VKKSLSLRIGSESEIRTRNPKFCDSSRVHIFLSPAKHSLEPLSAPVFAVLVEMLPKSTEQSFTMDWLSTLPLEMWTSIFESLSNFPCYQSNRLDIVNALLSCNLFYSIRLPFLYKG
jgi:hypothetical protein